MLWFTSSLIPGLEIALRSSICIGITWGSISIHVLHSHANASHFWLNEGWTTYMERVLQQFLHSPAHRDFSYLIGNKALSEAFKEYEDRPKYRKLVINFDKGENPDDAYSSVPYEKGANFLLYIGKMDLYLKTTRD